MRYALSRSRFALSCLLVASGVAGCAYGIPEVDPVDIPRLQQEVAADPGNTGLQVQLGMAHFKNQEFSQALALLQSAVDGGDESGPALLYLGMTHEEFGSWTEAQTAYTRYLDVGRSEPLKEEVSNRLQLIGQNLLRERAQLALANEANIGDPTPRSIAVMPFAYFSDNQDLLPLIYAISDMMVTDFAVSNALIVLERANIQSLLDEIGLTEDGYADPATGARAGRLLQAEHVVQGVLTPLGDNNLRIDTEALNVPGQNIVGNSGVEDALESLFDMEKELVINTIRDVLGLQLTPGEEQQIMDNRSANILAFLAYGRGLRQRDQGNYAAAQAEFQQAQEADPTFEAAAAAVVETQALTDASTTTTADLGATAAATGETGTGGGTVAPPSTATTGASTTASTAATATPGQGTAGTTSGTLSAASDGVNPTPTAGTLNQGSTQQGQSQQQQQAQQERDTPQQESQNQDNPAQTPTAQIRIVVRRPGGGQ